MYQYTTTNIINSLLDSNGVTNKVTGTAEALDVKRVGKFLSDKIIGFFKRPYEAGVKEQAEIVVPALTTGKVIRLAVELRLSLSAEAEYASTYIHFGKPVIVEVLATGTAATDAAALVKELNGLKDRFGHSYVTASASGATITLVAKEFNQRFYEVTVSEETPNNNLSLVDYVTKATGTVTVEGKLGFGNDDWMVRSVRVPTLENHRPFGIARDELPVIGGNYTEYVLRYRIEKDHEDGIVSGFNSITNHVFWVKSDLVAAFEQELANAGIPFNTVGEEVTDVTLTSGALDLSEYPTSGYALTYTTTPAGVTGAVWGRNEAGDVDAASSDADFSKVLVAPNGTITLETGHGLADTDKIGVQVTVNGFTKTYQVDVQA